jgi:hypothetical protein
MPGFSMRRLPRFATGVAVRPKHDQMEIRPPRASWRQTGRLTARLAQLQEHETADRDCASNGARITVKSHCQPRRSSSSAIKLESAVPKLSARHLLWAQATQCDRNESPHGFL